MLAHTHAHTCMRILILEVFSLLLAECVCGRGESLVRTKGDVIVKWGPFKWFLTAAVAEAAVGARREGRWAGQRRGSWNKPPTTGKKKSPRPAGTFTYRPTTKILVGFCVIVTIVVFPTQSVTGSTDAPWCSHVRACVRVSVSVSTSTHRNLKKKATNYFPSGSSWEVIRNVSVCFIFSSVCLGGVVESRQSSGPSCSVVLCLCLQLRAMYIS